MNPVWHFVNGVPVVPVLQITQQALAGDGSASAPSYSFASDPDTGFFRTTTDTIGIAANGGDIGRFSTSGFFIGGQFIQSVNAAATLGFGGTVGSPDVSLSRGAADRLDLASGDSLNLVLGNITWGNANGQVFTGVQQLTELTTIAAAATTDTTIQMPAGAVILGVSTRVTTVIPTAATFTVGDSGSAARFSTTTISTAANTTDAGTKAGAYYNASALSVRITPNLTPANNSGRVRVTIYYYTITPPTS